MQIEINKNVDTRKATKLLTKFFNMNDNSEYNYLAEDKIFIGYNDNSGFTYAYLGDSPSINIILDDENKFCYIYSSGLDGLEFIKYNNFNNITKLENVLSVAYGLDDKREDDYDDEVKKDKFIKAMNKKGWELI